MKYKEALKINTKVQAPQNCTDVYVTVCVCVRISLHSLPAATGAKTDGTIIPRLLVKVIAADTADLQHDLPQRLTPAV